MLLSGRTEKRIPLVVPVRLLDTGGPPDASEQAVTENVSGRGARVLVRQPRQSGEYLRVSLTAKELRGGARVVYCHPGFNQNFFIGLELKHCPPNWWHDPEFKALPASD
jgi:hypothetical protein